MPSSLFFNAIFTMFLSIGNHFGPFCFSIRNHYGGGRRDLGCREMKKKKKEIEKLGLRVNMYFPVYVFLMGCVEK